jgi:hypothetical protein
LKGRQQAGPLHLQCQAENEIRLAWPICPDCRLDIDALENVRVLSAAIERFTREWNAGATPFTWVKTVDEILAKAVRKTQAGSGARH